MNIGESAKTTIDYQYLPVLVARLVSGYKSFSVDFTSPSEGEASVFADINQDLLDEWANESHGGFVISVDLPTVWYRAKKLGESIEDDRYDIAEDVLTNVRNNLESAWTCIDTAIDYALGVALEEHT
jgi:hypothetical protein